MSIEHTALTCPHGRMVWDGDSLLWRCAGQQGCTVSLQAAMLVQPLRLPDRRITVSRSRADNCRDWHKECATKHHPCFCLESACCAGHEHCPEHHHCIQHGTYLPKLLQWSAVMSSIWHRNRAKVSVRTCATHEIAETAPLLRRACILTTKEKRR